MGLTIIAACKEADVSRVTFYKWLERSPKLRDKIELLKENRNQLVEDALFKAALKGDVNACKSWLSNRAKKKWNFNTNSINVSATANAGAKTEVAIDKDEAKQRITRNTRILKEYGLLDK